MLGVPSVPLDATEKTSVTQSPTEPWIPDEVVAWAAATVVAVTGPWISKIYWIGMSMTLMEWIGAITTHVQVKT